MPTIRKSTTASFPHPGPLSPGYYWYLALLAIIVSHVVAVAVAHRHLGGDPPPRPKPHAAPPEYQWMAAMVIYTMVSLWLLAQPLAQDKTTSPSAGLPTIGNSQALFSGR